jgi:hypothetical protein
MATSMTKPTARARALRALEEHPEGLSKSRLREIIEVNTGVWRRLILSMEVKGEVVITEEDVPQWGFTKIVRLP